MGILHVKFAADYTILPAFRLRERRS